MKSFKLPPKEQALEKNKNLVAKEISGEFKILLLGKSGVHTVGSGKTEDAAWRHCLNVFYGIK
jgi:hypothetical protein